MAAAEASDWGSLMPGPEEGWGSGDVSSVPTDGWGDAPAAAVGPRPEVRKAHPPRREDDEDAAKQVDGFLVKVLAGKKKLATLRSQMNEIDAKRQALESEINTLMPALQDARAQKGAAMGQIQATRLPQMWMDKARELNTRRRSLPGGCTSVAELNRMLKDLERQMSHGSLTLKQEKATIEQMRELKKGSSVVAAYEADQKMLDD
eukprot:2197319-Prymnesium_polylepis.1